MISCLVFFRAFFVSFIILIPFQYKQQAKKKKKQYIWGSWDLPWNGHTVHGQLDVVVVYRWHEPTVAFSDSTFSIHVIRDLLMLSFSLSLPLKINQSNCGYCGRGVWWTECVFGISHHFFFFVTPI